MFLQHYSYGSIYIVKYGYRYPNSNSVNTHFNAVYPMLQDCLKTSNLLNNKKNKIIFRWPGRECRSVLYKVPYLIAG